VNRRSLTFRLVFWYCGLLLGLGAAFALFTLLSFNRYVSQSTEATLSARAAAMWSIAEPILDDRATLTVLMEQRFLPEEEDRLIRISRDGITLYQSGPPIDRQFDPDKVPLPLDLDGTRVQRLKRLFLYSKRFTTAGGHVITIESGQATDVMVIARRRLVISLIFGLPLLLAATAVGGFFLVQRALTPVEAMISAAEALTFNSPRKRLPIAGTGDRIDTLGRTLNRMLDRLDNAYQQASRFSADAAHELRTPLAIMHGELELLAATPDLPADMQAAVASILGETERLSQIVKSLIAMSHLEAMAGKRSHLSVDLNALAQETIGQMHLLAEEKEITVKLPTGPAVVAAGDHDRLKQVMVNLLDNAIKYTRQGGRITVSTAETADAAILSVADTGIGIAPEHLPRIFDRFYRVATDRGEVGAGLGLAIVRSICAAHGGRITVESQPGAGTTFRVELPRASEPLTVIPSAFPEEPQGKAEAA
jgi:signal transduction histidine kinase